MAISFVVSSCQPTDYKITVEIPGCQPEACIRPLPHETARFEIKHNLPASDFITVAINDIPAYRITVTTGQVRVEARQKWAVLGLNARIQLQTYDNCKGRTCTVYSATTELNYATMVTSFSGQIQTAAPDVIALSEPALVRYLQMDSELRELNSEPIWRLSDFGPTQSIVEGVPWAAGLGLDGKLYALDPDQFGITVSQHLFSFAAHQFHTVVARFYDWIFYVDEGSLLRSDGETIVEIGAYANNSVVMAADDSLWKVTPDTTTSGMILFSPLEFGDQQQIDLCNCKYTLPETTPPLYHKLSGPAYDLTYEAVYPAENGQVRLQRYTLLDNNLDLQYEELGGAYTIKEGRPEIMQHAWIGDAPTTNFGLQLGDSWLWHYNNMLFELPTTYTKGESNQITSHRREIED